VLTKGLKNALAEASGWHPSGGFPVCYRKEPMAKLHKLGLVELAKGRTARGNPMDVWVLTQAGDAAVTEIQTERWRERMKEMSHRFA
jgi:hypothetical protein